LVIDAASRSVAATVAVGTGPVAVAVDPATHLAFVANLGGTVSVIAPGRDADLSIAPGDAVNADATGPGGAIVTYPVPAASDGGVAITPTCTPASGSLFPIGTTTVTCAVQGADDANGPVTTSFGVTVYGAAAQLADLLAAVSGVGPGHVLTLRVQQTRSFLAAGRTAAACSTLGAFAAEVQAWSGRIIPAVQAQGLLVTATRIGAVMGC
jgi:DNA-binding beta-propeller fold protein YncE